MFRRFYDLFSKRDADIQDKKKLDILDNKSPMLYHVGRVVVDNAILHFYKNSFGDIKVVEVTKEGQKTIINFTHCTHCKHKEYCGIKDSPQMSYHEDKRKIFTKKSLRECFESSEI